jgi:comEA protein
MKKAGYFWILICTVLILFFGTVICVFLLRQRSQIIAYNFHSVETQTFDETHDKKDPIIKDGKLDINLASVEELQMLPGIGETLAQRIVDYRVNNGNYTKIEDLLNVKGIGTSTLDAIKNYITTD